ncbi:uncharacterized protein LOC112172711 isoform X2 [Rosa chinensis]|uniref:uncharacterized protein LOC112172711 isoform X2 n=1 Tax=Rosa chinensis TaxID=74649 RepID=UPI001AD92731|nr:uncharacterized protein LOC112172711 isoform X2 [Rosa chinensis]
MDAFPPIPEHSFTFLHFDNLEDQMRTQTVLKDVYGCIKSLIPEHQVTVKDTGKLESKCEIFVENLRREDIRITFWCDIAREFDMERVKQLSPPVLAVFTGLRLAKFQAATTGHTCIMINPDIPIANEYKADYKVYVTIRDDNNQATLILMGRQAEQLFGINCQNLENKRLYPT